MRLALVRPAREGLKIFLPGSGRLLGAGRRVDVEDPYWMQHLAEGSIVLVDEPSPSAPDVSPAEAAAPSPRPKQSKG